MTRDAVTILKTLHALFAPLFLWSLKNELIARFSFTPRTRILRITRHFTRTVKVCKMTQLHGKVILVFVTIYSCHTRHR